MSSFFSIASFSHIISELRRVLVRFPLSVLISICVTGLFFYLVAKGGELDQNTSYLVGRYIITGIVLFFLSTAGVLFIEERKGGWMLRSAMLFCIAIFGFFFFRTLGADPFQGSETITFVLVTFVCFIAFLFFSPFARKLLSPTYSEPVYAKYFYTLATVFLMAAIMGAVVMVLGSVAIWSVDVLFEVSFIDGDTYAYWAAFSFALNAPIYGLARIPEESLIQKWKGDESKFFAFLIKYVGIPFLILYFVILYSYSVKVLLNFSDWPKGQVSWMVIGFSVFGYALYLFSYSIEKEYSLIERMRRYFPAFVLPQVLMLFYAIWLRIGQYDITMNRYFVVVFWIWLTGISFYLLLSRSKRLAYIPASLAVTSLCISIGPWSVYEFPYHRQETRFYAHLTEAKIWNGSSITPLASYDAITPRLSNDIYEGIRYLCEYDACNEIRGLFAQELQSAMAERKTEWERSQRVYLACKNEKREGCFQEVHSEYLSAPEVARAISDAIKVRALPYGAEGEISQFFSFSVKEGVDSIFPLQVEEWNKLYQVSSIDTHSVGRGSNVYLDLVRKTAELSISGSVVDTFPLGDMEKSLLDLAKARWGIRADNLSLEEMSFPVKGSIYEGRLILSRINLPNPAYTGSTTAWLFYADGYILIRESPSRAPGSSE